MVNLFRTGLLIAALTALFLAVGYWAAGPQGMLVALLLAAAMNFLTCWSADTIVLTPYGAREADAIQVPVPTRAVRDLASRAGLPMLKVYLIDSEQPNAFATGRDPAHSAVGVPAARLRDVTGLLAHHDAEDHRGVRGVADDTQYDRGGDQQENHAFGELSQQHAKLAAPRSLA